jgi:hypothetical protein
MNKTAIRRVATALLTGELATRKRGRRVGYNQRGWYNFNGEYTDRSGQACGTTACIAGHAVILLDKSVRKPAAGWFGRARALLGLTHDTANDLFDGTPSVGGEPSPKQAALVLFNLAETGKVDWSVVA